jgi:hypothetical protein
MLLFVLKSAVKFLGSKFDPYNYITFVQDGRLFQER